MIDPGQLRQLVVRPVLEHLEMHSAAAEELLLGTAAQESRLRYLHQLGAGPALGIYQVEPATHRDLYENYLRYHDELRKELRRLAGSWGRRIEFAADEMWIAMPDHKTMIGNLFYATAVARLIYRRRPEPLPAAGDLAGLAAYWKQHYNTPQGAGTVEEFERNYREIINGG